MTKKFCQNSFVALRQLLALALSLTLCAGWASAGVVVRQSQGVVMTGVDGIRYETSSGVVMTGVDGLLGYNVNNISWTDLNGLPLTTSDGVVMTGVDGTNFTGTDALRAVRADGVSLTSADGVVMTGVDGVVMTGVDGTVYRANSVVVRQPSGVVMTGVDGVVMTGVDGLQRTGIDGVVMTGVDGVVMTGVDEFRQTTARELVATAPDGHVYTISPDGVVMTGVDQLTLTGGNGVVMTGVDGVVMTGVDGLPRTGLDGVVMTGVDTGTQRFGLQGFDPELAQWLDKHTDDSSINAAIVYHRSVTDADIADLQRLGITGGTRFRTLPAVIISAKPSQIVTISKFPTVRSVWGNRTLDWSAVDNSRALTGVTRAAADRDLLSRNGGTALNGRGVTVAVLDTGLDATHGDISGRVRRNVKLADLQGVGLVGFNYPTVVEGLSNTDLLSGHGTFVGGIIAGNGARSGGKYTGVAPGASLIGLSAGDVNLFYVLGGFDYLLTNGAALGVRVVNCSFSANTLYNVNDPVNVATKMLTDAGINVVFSAGNNGPGLDSLNPYAVAPWVVSVGATDALSHMADFSARGVFASQIFRPTLVAPGVNVVSLRSGAAPALVGGLTSTASFSLLEAPFYTTASGTSFSAPQVAGTIALMLQANPQLAPAEVRDILQRTATPLPPYYAHEVGAGMLNAHAAVLEAAFPSRRMGLWRAASDCGQVRFVKEPTREFSGTISPSGTSDTNLTVPEGTLLASFEIGWGPLTSANDLAMSVFDPRGTRDNFNAINLPGLTGRRERAAYDSPAAGAWRVRVSNTLGLGTTQSYKGTFEVSRVEYGNLPDIGALSAASRDEVLQSLRSFVMLPYGEGFMPEFGVSRSELAAALVRGARVPQYLPGQPSYTDVPDNSTMNFVESAQVAPVGALFYDATPGGAFRPDEQVNRLTATIALVRAAGLRYEAEHYEGGINMLLDMSSVPPAYQGYVNVALNHGLMSAHGDYFHPQTPLTRAELAHAMVAVIKRASE